MLFGRKQRLINRLLIVEDEPLVAFDNEHALAEAGYQVVATVDRVREALAVIDAHEIDLILSDIGLTGERSGIDLAREALARGVRLMFVTGNCPIEAADLSIGWLAKPYTHRTLLDALDVIDERLAGREPRKLPAGLNLYSF